MPMTSVFVYMSFLRVCFFQNLSGGPQASSVSHGDEGDESWDDDDDGSSYRDDDSSSDGDEDADDIGTSRGEPLSVSCAGAPSQPVPSTSNNTGTTAGTKHVKELEWDHSSM